MRKKRVVQAGKCYHLVSRVAHRALFFDDDEKNRFVDLLMRVEFFSCVRVLAYCCMSNHIHVFIYLEDARELSEEEILARVNALYRGGRLAEALGEWKVLKDKEDKAVASFGGPVAGTDFRRLLAAYTRRMFHPSEFMKTLKQNMTMSFNSRRDHAGTIWEGRFYDKRSNPTTADMSAQAAYVDCNPAEAGICRNPAEYKWCSWAAAMAGDEHARGMYRFIYEGVADEWGEIVERHRAAICARLGEIDDAVGRGVIVDWLFGMFGSGKGKKADHGKEMQRDSSVLAQKCPVPRKRELSLEEGNAETATRLLAILAIGERSRGELASELGISSQPWLSRAYLSPLMAQGYIAQTLPKKPKSPLQRYRLLRKGKAVLA
ncbi:MAG: transposase [Kiritimatiellae bacterium]|nr:transposase [Kiritimatiellia bacterium]